MGALIEILLIGLVAVVITVRIQSERIGRDAPPPYRPRHARRDYNKGPGAPLTKELADHAWVGYEEAKQDEVAVDGYTRSGYVILKDGEFCFDAGDVNKAHAFMERIREAHKVDA